jgi:CHAD domain-containing protein
MAKAHPVRELTTAMPLRSAQLLIISTRVDELWSWAPSLEHEEAVKAVHDMRIAGKRLRYCLEFAAPCFGADYRSLLDPLKRLQDLLGEIHDCDAWMVELAAGVDTLWRSHRNDRRELRSAIGVTPNLEATVNRLRRALADRTPLNSLRIISDLAERRQATLGELREFWSQLETTGYRERLLAAAEAAATLGIQPAAAPQAPEVKD